MNLWTLLHDTRQLHERMLQSSLGHRQTAGSCAFAAYLLDFSVKRWLPQMRSCVRGGDGKADGGFFDATGNGHGHYWVEIDDGAESWVADITADQFGEAPICLLRLTEAQGRYVPGNQENVLEQMEVFGEWLAEAASDM
ncbi:hypothetical protein [Burkholderia ubonensis]|uniref:hypothetical protein n=1 Tax=Burkholderia ubonensis TaxID=101571 RepID=UPI0012F794A5|nr:hypothetical protein [Burkholderia ubonensis]